MFKPNFRYLIISIIALSLSAATTLSAFAADGDLDTTFGLGGIATYDFDGTPSNTDNDQSRDVAVQADGKIVMVGYAYLTASNSALAIMRFNADGTLDTTFGSNGRIINDYAAGAEQFGGVVIQPDGKIIAVGTVDSRRTRVIIRYNADGTVDTTFATNGVYTAPLAFGNNNVTVDTPRILLQPDGKILAMGTHKLDSGADIFGVRRLNADGTPDTSFGDNGLATARFTPFAPNLGDRPSDFALQADGKIVAGGFANSEDVAVARWNKDGTLDTTFGNGGKVQISFGSADATAWTITVQPDGKVLVGGRVLINDSDVLLVRLNTDGSLDTTFDNDGYASANFGAFDHAYKIFVRNNKIITVGDTIQSPNSDFLIARFNMDGSLDTSFGTNGSVITSINAYDFTYSAAFAPDGKLVIGGFTRTSTGTQGEDFAAVRYDFGNAAPNRTAMDFDGDGKADISVFRPVSGNSSQWWIKGSAANSAEMVEWGVETDILTPSDYDGDGKSDIGVWRPGSQEFYILNSSNNTLRRESFGQIGDKAITGDFDGDGKSDPAVFRSNQGTFLYRGSLNNPAGIVSSVQWGANGDKPVTGDFNGDGKSDFTVYRDGVWWILHNGSNGYEIRNWGVSTDKVVAGDYDGDGKTDSAVFRPSTGTWYIQNSSKNTVSYINWGVDTDIPVPADYDGDGKYDIAVYRSGLWYLLKSLDGNLHFENFGNASDIPVASAIACQ